MKPLFRELIAGAGAAGFFLTLLSSTTLAFLPLLGLACGVYFGLRLLLPAERQSTGAETPVEPGPLSRLQRAVERFTWWSKQVKHKETSADLRRVARALQNLMNQVQREPAGLPVAEELLSLHMPSALKLVERHVDLAGRPLLDVNAQQELDESRRTIGLIAQAFEAQNARLLEQDVEELRVDRLVFEELLRLEGRVDPGSSRAAREQPEHKE